MLKVGVLGAGHLGKIHLRLLQQSDKYELVGFYDENPENAQRIAEEFGYKRFNTIATLIHAVDVIDIVTPTLSHYKCAKVAIKSGKHVFIEKPISNTVAEAEEIIALDQPTADLAGRITGDLDRAGRPIGRFDPIIAAVALTHGLVLVTGNTSHYQYIQQLGYPLILHNWRV